LRGQLGGKPRLRKLRGSHLVFPSQRLTLTRSVSFLHPRDGRPVFAVPWEGVTLLGTTDVDQETPMCTNPAISAVEFDYLLEAAQRAFACLDLTANDVQATFAGVRPVINTGKDDPSKESREHILWQENGLLTIAGGKLTTFRLIARDVLRKLGPRLPKRAGKTADSHAVFDPPPASLPWGEADLSPALRLRLMGRHGLRTASLLEAAHPGELAPIETTPALWAELRWAARAEDVVHLDDLLLRRVRLGLLLPNGGLGQLEQKIRPVVQPELGWTDTRWQSEAAGYANVWKQCYDKPI
jgi:glycerol-3-phosphate dehydrogenase